MRSCRVVVGHPSREGAAGIVEAKEQRFVQKLVSVDHPVRDTALLQELEPGRNSPFPQWV